MGTSLHLRRIAVAAGLAAALAAGAEAQQAEPPPTFPAEVEQVTVDVVVTDGKGRPVTDLSRGDFEVYEDGVRQAITSLDLFRVPDEPAAPEGGAGAAPPRPRVSSNALPKRQHGRTFVVLFDDLHLTAFTAQRAKAAAAEFLRKETREGDRVTLVAPGSGAWWTARMESGREELLGMLRRLEGRLVPDTARDRMSDYEAMRIHVYRDNTILNRVQRRYETAGLMTVTGQSPHVRGFVATEDPVVTAKAAEVYFAATSRNQATLGAIERALGGLVPVKGRKSLVLVSDGFVYDHGLPGFRRVVDASRHANTAIYFLNSRGLEGLPAGLDAEFSAPLPPEDLGFAFAEAFEATEGPESLAADTGGFTVRNSNDLAGGLKRIADETRAYYLLGYGPTNRARDGGFRKIRVRVAGRRGLEVRARRGYYAPSEAEGERAEPGVDRVFQTALDSPYEREEVPLRMTHFVREETILGRARVYLAAEVDLRGLGLEEREGRLEGGFQFLLVSVNRDTGDFSRFDQKVDLELTPETRAELGRTWLPVVREFELAPGRHRAKMVVRDNASGKVGTVVHDFDVPDLKPFRASTPVLSDLREGGEAGREGERLAILARREFPPGASLYCQLDVYRAVREERSGMPRVSMGYEVRGRDGSVLARDGRSLITPTGEGAVSRLIGFSLEGASPGDYELVIRIRDEFSGKALEIREPFRVQAGPPSPEPAPAG